MGTLAPRNRDCEAGVLAGSFTVASSLSDSDISLAYSVYSNPGVYGVLLGSGVSSGAGIPTGWQIVQELIRRLGLMHGEPDVLDPVAWFRAKFSEEPEYGKVLEKLAPLAPERRNLLREFFEPTPEERDMGIKQPTAGHRALATLAAGGYVRVFITTNFDRLLEAALTAAGVPHTVVASADAVLGMEPLVHSRCTVVKVNGDYLDTRLRNTTGELTSYDLPLAELLSRAFDEFGWIVCGWSAESDTALRDAFIAAPTRRYSTYWALRQPPQGLTSTTIIGRKAIGIHINSADEFFTSLADRVDALASVHAPHPLSTPIAVAILKRAIHANDRPRIDDLVTAEAEEVCRTMDGGDDLLASVTAAEALHRIELYKSRSTTLLALLATGIFYWQLADLRLWLQTVQRVVNIKFRPAASYNPVWMDLRHCPGLLALYVSGISAIASDQYELLFKLMHRVEFRDSTGGVSPVVTMLHPQAVFRDVARWLPDVTSRYPASDWLHSVVRPHFHTLIPDEVEYDRHFDRFELLWSLTMVDIKSVLRGFGRFARMHGASGTNNAFARITNEQDGKRSDWAPLRAGFFQGSEQRYKEAFQELKRGLSGGFYRSFLRVTPAVISSRLSSRAMVHDETKMLHVYGWRRDGGPFFLDNPRTLEEGIAFAETVLKDCRRGFVRAEVKDIRSLKVLWTSAPKLG